MAYQGEAASILYTQSENNWNNVIYIFGTLDTLIFYNSLYSYESLRIN